MLAGACVVLGHRRLGWPGQAPSLLNFAPQLKPARVESGAEVLGVVGEGGPGTPPGLLAEGEVHVLQTLEGGRPRCLTAHPGLAHGIVHHVVVDAPVHLSRGEVPSRRDW